MPPESQIQNNSPERAPTEPVAEADQLALTGGINVGQNAAWLEDHVKGSEPVSATAIPYAHINLSGYFVPLKKLDHDQNTMAAAVWDKLDSNARAVFLEALNDLTEKHSEHLTEAQQLELVSSILNDIAGHRHVYQGLQKTCGPTSMQDKLCMDQPERYVAFMRDLVLKGEAAAKIGDNVKFSADALRADDADSDDHRSVRSISERIFQVAMMKYAIEHDFVYDPIEDISYARKDGAIHPEGGNSQSFEGLHDQECERAYEAIFGATYREDDPELAMEAIEQAIEQQRGTITSIAWNQEHCCHIIDVRKIENGRVYFYNPQGETSDARKYDGTTLHPPRQYYADTGMESMTIEDFKERIRYALVDDATKAGLTPSRTMMQVFPQEQHVVEGRAVILPARNEEELHCRGGAKELSLETKRVDLLLEQGELSRRIRENSSPNPDQRDENLRQAYGARKKDNDGMIASIPGVIDRKAPRPISDLNDEDRYL